MLAMMSAVVDYTSKMSF